MHRVLAYRNAAKAVREAPRSVSAMTRAGTVTELPGIGAHAGGEAPGAARHGVDPGRREDAREVPARAHRPHAAARARAQARPPALRRARHRLARGAARGGRGAPAARRARASARSSRRPCSPPSRPGWPSGRAAARPAQQGAADRRGHRRGAARPSRVGPGRAGGLGAPARRQRQGPRHHRHRERPARAAARLRRARRRSTSARSGRRGRRTRRAPARTPACRSTCASSSPTSSATCSSTSPARRRTTSPCARPRCGAGCTSASTACSTTRPATTHRCATEEEVYGLLGLPWIPPELREDRGELAFRSAADVPELIVQDDLRGDLHLHTVASDGRSTIEQMALGARDRGLEYLAITDHSATHGFGNHVDADGCGRRSRRARGQRAPRGDRGPRRHRGEHPPRRQLDYEDDLLAELDWVIASVHTSFGLGRGQDDRARDRRAWSTRWVDAIGHLTGRKIETRAAVRDRRRARDRRRRAHAGRCSRSTRRPDRRDLNDVHAKAAKEAGVRILIDSDAHSVANLGHDPLGRRDRAARVARRRPTWPTRCRGRSSRRCASARARGRVAPLSHERRQQLGGDRPVDRGAAERRDAPPAPARRSRAAGRRARRAGRAPRSSPTRRGSRARASGSAAYGPGAGVVTSGSRRPAPRAGRARSPRGAAR